MEADTGRCIYCLPNDSVQADSFIGLDLPRLDSSTYICHFLVLFFHLGPTSLDTPCMLNDRSLSKQCILPQRGIILHLDMKDPTV